MKMKLLKRVICFMLVLAMVLCNNAVLTFAETCNRNEAETGKNEEQSDTIEVDEKVQTDEELQADEEMEEEASVSVYDSRESKNSVSETESDFTYRKIQNGISILKYRGSDTDVVIPEEIDGCPVVDILYTAFQNNKTIKTIVMPDTVERIGSNAFENCTNLTDVTLSNKLLSIDNYAFANCEKLQTINLPEGLRYIFDYVFLNCKQFQTINFSKGLYYIGNSAFANCEKLQTIDLPEGLNYIGDDAFSGTALTEITFPRTFTGGYHVLRRSNVEKVTFADGTTKIPDYICDGARNLKTVELPETVTDIGSCAFENCSVLGTIELPEGLSTIGSYCFRNSGVTSVTVPSTLTAGADAFSGSNLVAAVLSSGMEKIPAGLFQSAKKLENVIIPDSVKEIGTSAFAGDESVTDITLPADLTSIRENAFLNCTNLKHLDIPSKVTRLGSNMLENTAVKEIIIPNTVTYANSAFAKSKIEKAVMESGSTKLPDGIYANMKFLSEAVLPDTITEIGALAFYNTSLSGIHLPEGITVIGKEAFENCSDLREITLPDGVKTLGYRFLAGSAVTDITVPATVTSAVYAFQDSGIEHADVASGMTKLSDSIFYGAGNLVQVQLPDTITEIGTETFYGCGKMDTITLPSKVKQIGREFIAGTKVTSIRVPATVTSANCAFYYSSLEAVVIEDGMKSLPSGMFFGASKLSDVTLADTIVEIEPNAFSYAAELAEIKLPENLTTIGERAFCECSKLEELTIPRSVTTIGSEFIKGTGITVVRLEGNVTSANGMLSGSRVTTVELPSGMTEIPNGMFSNATELTDLVLPKGITKIGSSAFYNCKSLMEMIIPNGVTYIGSSAFYGTGIVEIDLPLSVTSMNLAFTGSSIEKVNLDENITAIPNGAFSGASRLTDIRLPEGLKTIGDSAFEGTTSLTAIELPEIITTIGSRAFRNSGVEELYIPASVSSMNGAFNGSNITSIELDENISVIPDGMFYGAGKLTSIHLPEKLEKIGESAFTYSGITSVTIPKTVTSMKNAFAYSNVESVVFEDGCVSIPAYALADARKLTAVTIPEGVERIGSYAFSNDTALASVRFPETLTTIETRGFSSCSSLMSVNWPDQLVNIGTDAFSGVGRGATAYVSENSPGMYAAIRSGLFVIFTGRYEGGSAEVLDRENSSYYYTAGKNSYGKYIPFYIDYTCEKELFAEIQNPYIEVVIPDGMKLSLEYIELDGEFISIADNAYDSSKHMLRIPVSESEGHISIMLKAEGTGKVATYASLVYEKDGEQFMEAIGTITVEMPSLSMECSDSTTNGELYIQGVTNPFAVVYIYVNDEKADTVKADAVGDYSTTIQLTKRGDNVVKAALVADSTVSVTKYVEYEEEALEVTKFMLYYQSGKDNWNSIDLLKKTASGKRVVAISPNFEQRFVVAFSDNDKIKSVKIVSTKNGKKKYMAARRSKSGEFIAQGFFDPGNRNYVPGQLSISYTLKDNTKLKFDAENPASYKSLINVLEKKGFIGSLDDVKVTQNGYKNEGDKSTYNVTVSKGSESVDVSISVSRTPTVPPTPEYLKDNGYKKAETDDGSTVYVRYNKDDNSVEYITNQILDGNKGADGWELLELSIGACLIEDTGAVISLLASFMGLMQQEAYFNKCIAEVEGNPDLTDDEKWQIKNRVYAESLEDFTIFTMSSLVSVILCLLGVPIIWAAIITAAIGFLFNVLDEYDYYANIWLMFSVDPSGYVYEGVETNRIAGATAEIYYKEKLEDKQAVRWDASEYSQINPLTTNEEGEFAWDVPEGYWQVVVTKDGYETAYSEWMEVPPERTGVAIPLVSSAVPEVESVSADTNAAVVTFSQYMDPDTVSEMKLASADGREVAYKLTYDNSQKNKDENVFARIYKLVYNKKQEAGSKLTISVPDTVMNYAGNALEAYQENVVVANPCSIASEDTIQLAYEEEKTVAVEISNYREELALTCSSSSEVGLDASISSVDADGKAELTLNGIIPGTYQVELAVAGTDTRKTITVTVQEAEMAGEAEKEETDTGDADEGNKETEGSTGDGTGDTGTKDPDTGGNAGDGIGDTSTGGNAGSGTGDTSTRGNTGGETEDTGTGGNAGDGIGDTDTGENTSGETGFRETGENFHVHRYANQARFHWTADGKKCVAVFVCMVSGCGHEESVNVMVRSRVKRAATCTTKGITEYTAEVFFNPMAYSGKGDVVMVSDTKEISDIVVNPNNHTGEMTVKNQKPASYTENGYTGDTVCSACGKTVRKGTVTDKKILAKPARVIVKSSKKNVLVVSWKKSRDASGYEIQYAADKDFRKAEAVKVKSGKTEKTIKKLTGGKSYYVRIRAYKTVKVNGKNRRIYSGWVTCKRVTVK